jgi:hypothetical protein
MPARFYYAAKSEGLDPKVIIPNMESAQSFENLPTKYTSIYIVNRVMEKKTVAKGGDWVQEDVVKAETPEMALFMMGTTDQLRNALKDASKAGVSSFYIPPGSVLHIRYVRKKTTWDTRSVVGIAPLGGYWGLTAATNKDDSKPGGFPWIPMHTGGMGSGPSYHQEPGASITLSELMTKVLPMGQGKSAQY